MYAHIRWRIQNIYPPGCCCHLACHSQFEVDWQIHPSSHFIGFGSRQSQICQFGPGSDQKNKKKESFHLNRIILRLGILRWGRWKTLSGSFNKGCEWQTYMTVGGWQNISFWFFTGELWNKQQAEKLNYKAKKAKKAMSMTWPRAWGRRAPRKPWNNCPQKLQHVRAVGKSPLSHLKGPVCESKFPRVTLDLVSFLCCLTVCSANLIF